MKEPRYPLTIFYDRSCPLCEQELHAIRDYDRHGELRLVDCSPPSFHDDAAAAAGISAFDLMHQIHALDAAGRWYRGVDVFVLAYRAAGIEAVARLWAHPRLRPLWDRLYRWVARHRMLLSRLHLNAAFGRLVHFAARRAERRRQRCEGGNCSTRT
jgi:predicted DCC family thiol-disulfide oxidoreductase YuxK